MIILKLLGYFRFLLDYFDGEETDIVHSEMDVVDQDARKEAPHALDERFCMAIEEGHDAGETGLPGTAVNGRYVLCSICIVNFLPNIVEKNDILLLKQRVNRIYFHSKCVGKERQLPSCTGGVVGVGLLEKT